MKATIYRYGVGTSMAVLLYQGSTSLLVSGWISTEVYSTALVLIFFIIGFLVSRRIGAEQVDNRIFELLTIRELQILHLLGESKSNKEIAQEINRSPQTVKTHVRNLYRKMNISSRRQAWQIVRDSRKA